MDKNQIIYWLGENCPSKLNELWELADKNRKENVGDAVHLRGLLEISNYCSRFCGYCGINAGNSSLTRYRIPFDQIISCAAEAESYGYGTVVLQAGEDVCLDCDFIERVVKTIKQQFKLAVTLSLGEREDYEFQIWRKAGADRYLLRFETSNRNLFNKIHPPKPNKAAVDRLEMLQRLRKLGYEIGSGVMIGIPGQSYEDLANDILTFKRLDLDMVGVGPYIPHPKTPLGAKNDELKLSDGNQVEPTELMCYKVIALTRLVCPQANIPSTSALATLNLAQGRENGLSRGANILMPNITPIEYRQYYEIYPSKACIFETAKQCRGCMTNRIKSIGRYVGSGKGSRQKA